jgi:archaellum component FlaC
MNGGPTFALDDNQRDIEQAEDLIEEINSLLEELPERAEDFYQSVSETVHDISIFIDKHRRVTKKQINALENMLYGIQKWSRD